MSEITLGFDMDRKIAYISIGDERKELNEAEYYDLQHRMLDCMSNGFHEVHRKERESKLMRYIRDHPGCTYNQIGAYLFSPRNHMGYRQIAYSLDDLVESGAVIMTYTEDRRKQYRLKE